MLFLLSCLFSYQADTDQATITLEQTKAISHVNFDYGHKSSVKINTLKDGLLVGHGSGNYFKIGKNKSIVTAGHVVQDGSAFFILDSEEPVMLEAVYVDPLYDVAFMVPYRELIEIKPVNYKINKIFSPNNPIKSMYSYLRLKNICVN